MKNWTKIEKSSKKSSNRQKHCIMTKNLMLKTEDNNLLINLEKREGN
mgnify:CR=1 FL=1